MTQSSKPASCVALLGLDGIGKSQLALEFAYRAAAESPQVWVFWIYAHTLEHIEEGFRRIAECIKLPTQNLPWDEVYQLVCDWLHDEQNGQWILILDGADDPNVWYKTLEITNILKFKRRPIKSLYLLNSLRRNSSLIVTTDNKDVADAMTRGHGSIIEVGPMPVVEATSLFRKILGPKFQPASDMNAAVNLVKGLRLIPLAITQAARYIDKQLSKTTLVNFLEKLEESDDEKMGLLTFDANGNDDSKTIDSIWQISFNFIRSQRPSAANLLLLMSFFDRRGIPKWLLPSDTQDNNTPRANSPSIMGRLELDASDGEANDDSTDTFDGDIDMLINHSFIAANRTRDIFEMHGLVQFAARRSMNIEQEDAYCDQFIHRLATEFPRNPLGNWSTCQELFAHVQAAAKYSPGDDALKDWANLLYNGGRYARLLGDYGTAKHMSNKVSKAIQIIREEEQTEGEHTRLLQNSSLTALILMDQGLYDEAERLFTQVTDAFKIMEGKAETARSDTLTSMNNLASVYRVQGRWKEAEKLLTQVRYHRAEVNKVGPSALATLANLASTYRAQGRYVEATALQEVVLESCKIELGEGHPQTLTNKSNLASLYRIRGELEKAEQLQVQAMNARDIRFGREHPDILTSMNGLASIFRTQGRLWDAEEMQVQVVELRRTTLGADHPNTMASMNNLALIFHEQGNGEKAIELQSLVVDMCKVKFGDSHPHTLTSINNLALIRKSQGQDEDAMRLMKLCSDDRQNILGQEHPYTVSSMAALRRWSE
jgi:tetratricopeptide (TPR) repeat protein